MIAIAKKGGDGNRPAGSAIYAIVRWAQARQRFLMLGLAVLVNLFCGSVYGFGLIALPLKTQGHFSTKQVDVIYSFGATGQYVTLLPGYIYDKHGPQATFLYGGVCAAVGYGLFGAHLASGGRSEWILSCAFCLAAQGSASLYLAGLFANLSNFPPAYKGRVVGSLASAYGLSAAFLGLIFESRFQNTDVVGYVIHLAWALSVGAISGALLIRSLPFRERRETDDDEAKGHGMIEMTEVIDTRPSANIGGIGGIRRAGGGAAQSLPAKPETDGRSTSQRSTKGGGATVLASLAQEMLTVDFIMFTAAMVLTQGVCAMVIGNASLFCDSLGLDTHYATLIVKIISVANCGGRFVFGFLLDALRHIFVLSFVFVVGASFFIVSQTLILVELLRSSGGELVALSMGFVGLVAGINAAASPAFLSDRFSESRIATLHAITTSCVAAGTTLFNMATGTLYDREALRQTFSAAFISASRRLELQDLEAQAAAVAMNVTSSSALSAELRAVQVQEMAGAALAAAEERGLFCRGSSCFLGSAVIGLCCGAAAFAVAFALMRSSERRKSRRKHHVLASL